VQYDQETMQVEGAAFQPNGSGVAMISEFGKHVLFVPQSTWDQRRSDGWSAFPPSITVDPKTKAGPGLQSNGYAEDPVNTLTGSFTDSMVDLGGVSASTGTEWVRYYDSGGTAGDPHLGFSYQDRLEPDGSGGVNLFLASGRSVHFASDGSGGYELAREFTGELSAEGSGFKVEHLDATIEHFDSAGLLISREFWDGQSVTVGRTAGAVTSITSSVGPSLAITNGAFGPTQVTASDGRSVEYDYDLNGFLTDVTLPGGLHWSLENDSEGQVLSKTDPAGVEVVHNTYDGSGRVVSQLSATGSETIFGYEADERSVYVTDVETGEVVVYVYDTEGRLVALVDPLGEAATREYDSRDMLTSSVSRGGGESAAVRNAVGLPSEVSEPGAGTTTITYDGSNRVILVEDGSGAETSYTYDGSERIPSSVTDDLSHTTTYDVVNGLIVSTTDADGVTTEFDYDSNRRKVASRDGVGNETTFEYDTAGRRTATEASSGARTETAYDAAGRPAVVTAADGGVTTNTYNSGGQLTAVEDPTGATTTYSYDAYGRLAAETDPLSRVTSYTYDALGQLTTVTNPDASTSSTTYGAMGRVTAGTDELGRTTSYTYDAEGNVTATTDPESGVVGTSYDAAGRVTAETDALDRTTSYDYDTAGRLESVTSPAGTTTYEYDALGRQVSVSDPRGGVTETSYTPGGRVDTVTNPWDGVTGYDYDAAGRATTVTAPGGLETTFGYDVDSRVTSVTSPGGLMTATTFDPAGRESTVTDPAGVTTTNTWSLRGELLTRQREGDGAVSYVYDAAGQATSVTDALNNTTTYAYNSRGLQTTRTDPAGKVWSTTWNAAREKTSETDPLSRSTVYTYDDAGRLESTVDPSGRTLTNTWDAAGQLSGWSATDGTNTLAASFAYDTAGRRTTATIGGRTYTYAYTVGGDPASVTNPDGRTLSYTWDTAGRRTGFRDADGTGYAYAYEPAGRLESVTPTELLADTFTGTDGSPADASKWVSQSAIGGTSMLASNKARLAVPNVLGATATLKSNAEATAEGDTTFTYQFDSAATPTRLRAYLRYVDAANSYRVEIAANNNTGRIYREHNGNFAEIGTFPITADTEAHRVRFQLDGNHLRAKTWDPSDPEPSAWATDITDSSVTGSGIARFQIAKATGTANAFTLDDWTLEDPNNAEDPIVSYDWDDDGHLSTEDLPGSDSRTWTWHDGQLASYTQAIPGANRTTTLDYDTSGRIATETTAGSVTDYSYDDAGQLTEVDPIAGTATTYTYDSRGRRSNQNTGSASTAFTYDDAGQLTVATPSTGTATTYSYDGAGRRTTETTGSAVTTYTYDAPGQLSGITLPSGDSQARVLDPEGSPESLTNTIASTPTTWHLDWDHTQGLAELAGTSLETATTDLIHPGSGAAWSLAVTGTDRTSVASDIHGSAITATATTAARSASYNAWGDPVGADTLNPKLGYRGELTTQALVHLRARDYQPETANFTTTDPLDGEDGTPTLNTPYHYADNDPLNKTDPTGLRPEDKEFVGIGDVSSCPDSSGITMSGSYEDIAGICDAIPDDFLPTTASSAFGQFIARLYAIEAMSSSNDDFVRTAAAEIGGFTAGRFGLVPECRPGGACRVPVENEILGGSGWRRDFIDDDDGDGDGLPSPARHFIGWFAAGYFHPHTADDTLEVAEADGSGQSMQDRRSGDVAIDLGIQLRRGNNSRRETIFFIETRAGDPSNTYNGSNPNEPTGGDPLACWLPLAPC
jgi:RHS repeat-associated protein